MAKILVFDSDARDREAMKAALTALGYETVLAIDGYSVLPLAEMHQPGLVMLDYKLPEADGFEILKRLRSSPKCASTPIIFWSATPKFEIEFVVMDDAHVGYVDKPLDVKQLKAAIEDSLGVTARAPAPLPEPGTTDFTGEPDLDGGRDAVIELD